MIKGVLLIDDRAEALPPEVCIIHWEGRNAPPGEFSLPSLLDKHLLAIRAEHMRWAWQTGNMVLQSHGGRTLADFFACDAKPSMWWTSLIYERHPKLSPELYPLYKLRCLELFMQEKHLQELTVIGGDRRILKILRQLAKAHGWIFKHIAGKKQKTGERKKFIVRVYEFTPAWIRATARFAHWFWKIRSKLPFAGQKIKKSGERLSATIATYFPNIDLKAAAEGRFHSRYWEKLHGALNRQAKFENPHGPHFVRWVFIRFPSPELSFRQCLDLRDLFQKKGEDGLSFHYLEEFLTGRDLGKSLWRWVRLSARSLLVQNKFAAFCCFENSRLDFWPLIKKQWVESFRGWRCLERCLQNFAFAHYYQLVGKQRWSLYPLENCPWERMLVVGSQSCRHPVYGAQHSIVRPTDFRYFDDPQTFEAQDCFQPDIVGGNGKDACSQWQANGMPEKFMRELEALRYQYLAQSEPPASSGVKNDLPAQAGVPVSEGAGPELLVLTSFFRDETDAHLFLLGEALNAGLLTGWRIALKPHPYLPVNDWLESRPADQKKMIRLATGPLSIELRGRIAVWASNSTTAALEAALKGLPLMVMRAAGDFDLCPIQNVPGLVRTGNLQDVRQALAGLAPLKLPKDYLNLEPGLAAWRKLLGLDYKSHMA